VVDWEGVARVGQARGWEEVVRVEGWERGWVEG
jgi:hypothetical protein